MNNKDHLTFIVAHLIELSSLFHDLLSGGTFLGPNKRTSIARYKILKSLDISESQCLTAISNCVHYKKNTLSELMNRMANDGLVLRRSNAHDRRKTELTITAAGRAALNNFEQAFLRVMKGFLDTLPVPLRESFLKSLGSLVEISLSYHKNAASVQNKTKAK